MHPLNVPLGTPKFLRSNRTVGLWDSRASRPCGCRSLAIVEKQNTRFDSDGGTDTLGGTAGVAMD